MEPIWGDAKKIQQISSDGWGEVISNPSLLFSFGNKKNLAFEFYKTWDVNS